MNSLRLIGCIVVCQGAGIVGSIFTAQSVRTWYTTLQKPAFSPPNWIFGPVWIILYVMMGTALYLVWRKSESTDVPPMVFIVFAVQLSLNGLWSFVFFGLRSPLWGFVEITVLWLSILLTIALFRKVSQSAALLLVPYILWVSFAAILNFSIWRLNPE